MGGNGGSNMSLGVSGGTDLTRNLLFNWVADLVGNSVADLSGDWVTFLVGDRVADFSWDRVAFLSGNWVTDFSGDRHTLLFLTGNLDLDWVAVGDWLGNTHSLSDRLGRWDASLHNIGSAHSLGNIPGDSVADLTGHGVAHFTGNWVADLASNRVAHLARNWARSLNWDLTAHSLGGGLALRSRNGVSMSGNSGVVKATPFTIFFSISFGIGFALPATSKSSTKRRNNSSKRRNNSSAISRDNSTSNSGSINSDSSSYSSNWDSSSNSNSWGTGNISSDMGGHTGVGLNMGLAAVFGDNILAFLHGGGLNDGVSDGVAGLFGDGVARLFSDGVASLASLGVTSLFGDGVANRISFSVTDLLGNLFVDSIADGFIVGSAVFVSDFLGHLIAFLLSVSLTLFLGNGINNSFSVALLFRDGVASLFSDSVACLFGDSVTSLAGDSVASLLCDSVAHFLGNSIADLVDDGIIFGVALSGSFNWSNSVGNRGSYSMDASMVVKCGIGFSISISLTLHNSSIGKTHHAEKKGKMLSHGYAGFIYFRALPTQTLLELK